MGEQAGKSIFDYWNRETTRDFVQIQEIAVAVDLIASGVSLSVGAEINKDSGETRIFIELTRQGNNLARSHVPNTGGEVDAPYADRISEVFLYLVNRYLVK